MSNYIYTIAIPVVKTNFIEQTLISALSQKYLNIEIIVLNNAGDKKTKNNIKLLINQIDKNNIIKYYENDSQLPPIENWNKILNLSSGDYFCLLSDDDYIDSYFIKEINDLTLKYPMLDLFHTRINIIDENSNILNLAPSIPEFEQSIDFIWHRLNGYRTQFVSDFVCRTNKIKEISGFVYFEDAWASDDATWFMLSYPHGVGYINKPLFYYRDNSSSLTNSKNKKTKLIAIQKFQIWLNNFLENHYTTTDITVKLTKAKVGYWCDKLKSEALLFNIKSPKEWVRFLRLSLFKSISYKLSINTILRALAKSFFINSKN